jgi:hypothetical protein
MHSNIGAAFGFQGYDFDFLFTVGIVIALNANARHTIESVPDLLHQLLTACFLSVSTRRSVCCLLAALFRSSASMVGNIQH